MRRETTKLFDVAVVGSGMAGMAAAVFAASRGLTVVQIGNGGGILFASGLLDLLAVQPVSASRTWEDPFAAMATLTHDDPEHPLARVAPDAIREAFGTFVSALESAGIAFAPLDGRNRRILTSVGTVRHAYGVPRSMVAGAAALETRGPCLLVDFRGLREYSARQIVATIGAAWPGLRAGRVEFPGYEAVTELYAAHLARALEDPAIRGPAIERVRPLIGDAASVGFPAVLGLTRSREVHAAFEAGLGVPVFEVPTMPTSVPGLRLSSALESVVAGLGVHRRIQARVARISFEAAADGGDTGQGRAILALDGMARPDEVAARNVILATGRFSGGGLEADREAIVERIIGLRVQQPEARSEWHDRDFLAPAGHAANRAGVVVDRSFRPLDAEDNPVWPGLYAIGSLLAGADWMRQKCGSGLAIATAWTAIEAIVGPCRAQAEG